MKLAWKSSLSCIVSVVFLVACSAEDSQDDVDSEEEQEEEEIATTDPAAEETLVVAVPTLGTEVWAPHLIGGPETMVQFAVGETLVRTSPDREEYEPGLAESWDLSEDLQTWTFVLQEGVEFHDDYGTVTSEDVKYSFEQMLRDDATHSRAAYYQSMLDGDIDNIEIVDDREFRIHTSGPSVDLLSNLVYTNDAMTVVSKDHWEEVGDEEAARNPVGTGPWEFEEHEPGARVTFNAVADHWRKPPGFQRLELVIVGDESARLNQVQAGETDLAEISLPLVPEAEAIDVRIIYVENAAYSNIMLGGMYPGSEHYDEDAPWIQADAPEQGRAVREAMSIAIDRHAIVESLQMGLGEAGVAPAWYFPSAPFSRDWDIPEQDLDRAQVLLAEGGYPDGFEITMAIYAQSGRPMAEPIAEAVSGMWEEAGLQVTRETVEWSPTWKEVLADKSANHGYAYQHTQTFFEEPAARIQANHMPNDGTAHFYHDAHGEYVDRMLQERDPGARHEIARELGDLLVEDMPGFGVASAPTPYAASERVGDWQAISGLREPRNLEYVEPA